MPLFYSFLNNIVVMLAVAIIHSFVFKSLKNKKTATIISGFAFSIAVLITMQNKFVLTTGVVFDARSVVISICGMFAGPFAVFMTSMTAIVHRIWTGGGGTATGIYVIISSALIGLLFYHLRKSKPQLTNAVNLYIFGFIVHINMMCLMVTLPQEAVMQAYKTITLPVLLILPLGTLCFGKLLSNQEEQIKIETMFKSVAAAVPVGIGVVANRKITWANDKFLRLIGRTQEEIINKDTHILYVNDDEYNFIGNQYYKELREKGRAEVEIKWKHKDGRILDIFLTGVPLDANNLSSEVVFGVLDITERRRMQEELRRWSNELEKKVDERTEELRESKLKFKTIFDSSRDAVMLLTPEKGFLEGNPATIEIFGCKDKAEFTRMSPADLSPKYQPDGKLSTVKAQEMMAIAMEKGSHYFEWTHKRVNGKEFLADVLLARMKWEDRMILQATVRDITERKKAEEELEAMTIDLQRKTELLETANKESEAFSYSVSHDLRAPLRSIDGFSKALVEDCNDKLDEQGKKYLSRVRAACQQMSQLIEDMLMLSRITRSEMRRNKVDLSALAKSIADEFMQSEPQRKVEFVIAPSVTIDGDESLLNIMLHNLLGNAWKYTGKHPSARIEFGVTKKEEATVCFVADDGAGFDMKYANKLFGAFQRLHAPEEFEGTGIGLAIVQRIVNRHGGKVWAQGEVEKGATFYFTLV